MGFNFPNSPVLNDTYVYGGQSYTWSGYAWMLTEGGVAAPADYVDVTGDVMTGPLVLSGAPIYGDEAVTKNYVDNMALASGSGNVIGPAASTADHIVTFDGVTGKLIKDSGIPAGNLQHAASFDALAYNGMQINGGHEVSQENGTTARSSNGYVCDGWQLTVAGSMVVNAAVSPWPTSAALGCPNIIFIQVTTASPSLAADDRLYLAQPIEGYRISRLAWGGPNAQPITIGFWSAHAIPGIYSVSANSGSGAPTRSYVCTYNQLIADVPQYNVVTIPGCQDGPWNAANLIGMYVCFASAAGANFTSPVANSWQPATYVAAPGQVNAAATANAFRIFGVAILPGIEAPSAARASFLLRPYDQELLVCQKYWESGIANGPTNTDGLFSAGIVATQPTSFKVRKRGVPIMTYYDNHPGNVGRFCGNLMLVGPAYNQIVTGGDIVGLPTVDGFVSDFSATACGTNRWSCFWTANSRL